MVSMSPEKDFLLFLNRYNNMSEWRNLTSNLIDTRMIFEEDMSRLAGRCPLAVAKLF